VGLPVARRKESMQRWTANHLHSHTPAQPATLSGPEQAPHAPSTSPLAPPKPTRSNGCSVSGCARYACSASSSARAGMRQCGSTLSGPCGACCSWYR